MRIKSCIGADMSQALDKIREELGPDAIIISSFDRDDGSVELRAASEHPGSSSDPFEERLKTRLQTETLPAFIVGDNGAPAPGPARQWDGGQLKQALQSRGLPERLRSSLISTAIASEIADMDSALAEALKSHFSFTPLETAPCEPVMFIGPPGAGKTSMWAKAATRCALEGKEAHMLSLDTVRTGAAGQSASLAALLGLRARMIKTPTDFATAMKRWRKADIKIPCFIDTPTANPYDLEEMEFLAAFLAGAEKQTPITKVLVLDAGTGGEDAADQAAAFAALGIKSVIMTKLDTIRRFGGSLAGIFEFGLAISAFSSTPYLADGITMPDAKSLSGLLLSPHQRPAMAEIGNQTSNLRQLKALG